MTLRELIERELEHFIEWPGADKRVVTATSAKLLAEHVAELYADHIAQDRKMVSDHVPDAGKMVADHVPGSTKKIGRPQIREVFMRNGFTIAPDRDDLEDRVYEAAFELLEMATRQPRQAAVSQLRTYLSGPMTGLPDFNFPAFNVAAQVLRSEGLDVINPAGHGVVEGWVWGDYLRQDIGLLATCSDIVLLPGWSKSKGARLELHIAEQLGMRVHLYDGAEWAGWDIAAPEAAGLVEALELAQGYLRNGGLSEDDPLLLGAINDALASHRGQRGDA